MGKPNIYWRMNKDSPASESTVNLRCPIASNDRRPSHSAQASTYTIYDMPFVAIVFSKSCLPPYARKGHAMSLRQHSCQEPMLYPQS